MPEIIYTNDWTPGADVSNELAALMPTLAPHTVLAFAARYKASCSALTYADDIQIMGMEPEFGITRSGHTGSAALFKPGNRSWMHRISCEAEGWETSDTPVCHLANVVSKTGFRLTEYDLKGRGKGVSLENSPGALFYNGRTEGMMSHHHLTGACHGTSWLKVNGFGGYLSTTNRQGDFIKTVMSNNYHGPVGCLVALCGGKPLRNFADLAGGGLYWQFSDNTPEGDWDEIFDLKFQVANLTELAGRLATGTSLVKHIEFLRNSCKVTKRAVTMTTGYGSIAQGQVSEADHDAACVSNIKSTDDKFERVGTENIEVFKNNASRRLRVTGAEMTGKMVPYAEEFSADNQGFAPRDNKIETKFVGEWQNTVPIKGDDFEFELDDGSLLENITNPLDLFAAANDLAGMTLRGTGLIDPSCTAPIYKWDDNGYTVEPFLDTMTFVA